MTCNDFKTLLRHGADRCTRSEVLGVFNHAIQCASCKDYAIRVITEKATNEEAMTALAALRAECAADPELMGQLGHLEQALTQSSRMQETCAWWMDDKKLIEENGPNHWNICDWHYLDLDGLRRV